MRLANKPEISTAVAMVPGTVNMSHSMFSLLLVCHRTFFHLPKYMKAQNLNKISETQRPVCGSQGDGHNSRTTQQIYRQILAVLCSPVGCFYLGFCILKNFFWQEKKIKTCNPLDLKSEYCEIAPGI